MRNHSPQDSRWFWLWILTVALLGLIVIGAGTGAAWMLIVTP